MVRTQIQITNEQANMLKRLANREGVSAATLIRRSIDHYVREHSDSDLEPQKRRALAVVGKYASASSNVSQKHDRYLAELYAEVGN